MGKIKFLNKMFSVQNQYSKDIKYKVLKILGFEIKIKTNKKQQIVPNFREIRLELTNMCGCHCYMCPRDNMTRKQGVISVSNLSTILSKIAYINYPCFIHLHGQGEALLCKDLEEILMLIKKQNANFIPHITTTLAYKIEKNKLESILKAGLEDIIVSLYAYDKDSYKIVHGSDNFEYVLENLKNLAELKNNYNVKIQINLDDFGENYPINIAESERIEKRENFKNYLKTMGYLDSEFGKMELHSYGNLKEQDKFPKYTSKIPCSIAWGTRRDILQIDWEGNVIPCCFDMNSTYKWGNILEQSLEEIFSSKARSTFIKKVLNFDKIKLCEGCFEYKRYDNNIESEYFKELNNR